MFVGPVTHQAVAVANQIRDANVVAPDSEDVRLSLWDGHVAHSMFSVDDEETRFELQPCHGAQPGDAIITMPFVA